MKAHIKIPKGWRRIRKWCLANKNDRWLDTEDWVWRRYLGKRVVYASVISIRRKSRARKEAK